MNPTSAEPQLSACAPWGAAALLAACGGGGSGSQADADRAEGGSALLAVALTDEDAARLWTWKSKKYFRTSANECWVANADGSMGKWAGVYDPIADSIDADAEEPEIEAE